MRRTPLLLAALLPVLVACSGNDVIGTGSSASRPSGSAPYGPTTVAPPAGFRECAHADLYRIAYPESWTVDEGCSEFTPPEASRDEESAAPAITIEALTEPFEQVVGRSTGEGAVRERVAVAAAQAERVTYQTSAGTGAGPIVSYSLDLVPGTGSGVTSEEQTLVVTAVAVPGSDAQSTSAVLDQMLDSLRIVAHLPERGDPPQ